MRPKTQQLDTADVSAASRATQLKSALLKALSNIGWKNGHAAPSEEERGVHLIYVYAEAKSFFEKMYKKQLEDVLTDRETMCNMAPIGDQVSIIDSENYVLTLKKANPSTKVDVDKFVTELRRLGVEAGVVASAKVAATVSAQPARTYRVIVK